MRAVNPIGEAGAASVEVQCPSNMHGVSFPSCWLKLSTEELGLVPKGESARAHKRTECDECHTGAGSTLSSQLSTKSYAGAWRLVGTQVCAGGVCSEETRHVSGAVAASGTW